MKREGQDFGKRIGVTVKISAEANDLLNQAIRKTNRTKRKEAELRLEDHITRFESITQLGQVTERQVNK